MNPLGEAEPGDGHTKDKLSTARIVIVTGGRDFVPDKSDLALLAAHTKGHVLLIHGNAEGADKWAAGYVSKNNPKAYIRAFDPEWDKYGKAAGNIRNRQMIEYAIDHSPIENITVLAFRGDKGTKDMVSKCLKRGLIVLGTIPKDLKSAQTSLDLS